MTNHEKRKVAEMVTMEQKWLYDHPEYSIPQWYINLIISAVYRLQMNDYDGAAHDIQQAITGRMESMGVCL